MRLVVRFEDVRFVVVRFRLVIGNLISSSTSETLLPRKRFFISILLPLLFLVAIEK